MLISVVVTSEYYYQILFLLLVLFLWFFINLITLYTKLDKNVNYKSQNHCFLCFFFPLKAHIEPHNEDAFNGYSKIYPIQEEIALAEQYVDAKEYAAAVDLISKIIEVILFIFIVVK